MSDLFREYWAQRDKNIILREVAKRVGKPEDQYTPKFKERAEQIQKEVEEGHKREVELERKIWGR